MLPNTPPMLEAHYGVPMCGAVLNALNTRLDAAALAFILGHGEAKALITDTEFAPVMREALASAGRDLLVVDVDDPERQGRRAPGRAGVRGVPGRGRPRLRADVPGRRVAGDRAQLHLGHHGNPKGVVYHHRGAHLNAVGNALVWSMPQHPVYLWTLPMFHCNGWCFPWTVALQAGTQVCLRKVAAETIFAAIAERGVTHLCGAPDRHGHARERDRRGPPPVRPEGQDDDRGGTPARRRPGADGAARHRGHPRLRPDRGLRPRHGLRLARGVVGLDSTARSGQARPPRCALPRAGGLEVMDPATMVPVPRDGETMGEIMMRGHDVMMGYLKNPTATAEAFKGGWFRTGDLGVMHEDGYLEIRDRSKDIIISGGENVSSIEVEGALYRHPDVLEAAVVARPDETWGETPCAFVPLKEARPPPRPT
jgi:fatty-acyl-CoA synthase